MVAMLRKSANFSELREAVADYFACLDDGRSRVLLVPFSSQIDEWRIWFAQNRPEMAFDMKICSLFDYVDEKWGLFGDFRVLCRPTISRMTMYKVLDELCESGNPEGLRPSPGTVDLLYNIVRKGTGFASFDETVAAAGAGELPTKNSAIWRALSNYYRKLSENGFIEYGEALQVLGDAIPRNCNEVAAGFESMLPSEIRFLNTRGAGVFLVRGENDAAFAQIDRLAGIFESSGEQAGESGLEGNGPGGEPSGLKSPGSNSAASTSDGMGSEADGDSGRDPEIEGVLRRIYTQGETVESHGAIRFALSSGIYSEAPVVARAVKDAIDDGFAPSDIYVSSEGLGDGFECQQILARMGVSTCGRTRVPLNETPFVKALAGFADPEKMELSSFGDFIMSPFSGIPIFKAQDLCAKWRGTKGVELVEILSDIVEVSESCHEIIMFFLNEKYDKMSRLMIANYTKHLSKELGLELHGHGESDLRRAVPIELKLAITASEKAVTMLDLGNHLGIPPAKCVELMSLEKVSCRYMIRGFGDHAADEASCVRFGTMGGLSSRKAGVVVLTGLASSTFPVSRDLDAGDEVLDSCGTPQLDDMLEQRRHAFYMAIQAAEKRLVVERRLNDADGNEERPSVLFEELSDCYRQDLSDFDSMDKTTSLPECLVDDGADVLRIMQEDDLGTITSVPSYIQPDDGEEGPLDCKLGYMDKSLPSDFPVGISPVDAESLSDDQRLDIAAMALGTPDNPKPLTPTGIELYMMCPYRWFVESKVRPQTLDVVLDTMALGTFTHALLMKYYYLLSDGLAKPRRITEDDVPHVAPMLQACRDSFLDEQAHLDPSGPFTKLTQLEKRQLDEKTRRVSELLVDDCSFLGEFVPSFLEQKFGGDNGEFVYGGHPFVGIIDRMDLRRDGKVVVIDYKGGLNSFDFPVHGSEMTTPEHMQVLIYAAVAQRVFGYEVVGALYRSYSRRQEVRGAFDMSHIGPENIFGNDKGGLSANEMSELMEVVEDDVRSAIQRMHVGDIVPNPKSGKTCKYCIVPDCPRRLS